MSANRTKSKNLYSVLFVVFFLFFCLGLYLGSKELSNDKNWTPEQKTLASASFDEENIYIKNIRNFTYRSETDFDENYYDSVYKRGSVKNIWYVLVPFGGHQIAHAFLSFEFEDGRFLSISIEARKVVGEKYSPIKGMFRHYELAYIIGDERDIVGLRANYQKDPVYLYRLTTSKEVSNKVFEDMLTRQTNLKENPEFYNTITNSCASNLVDLANKYREAKVGFDYRLFLPEKSDELLYNLKIIENDTTLENLKQKHLINELSEKNLNEPEYSKLIRENILAK